MQDFEAPFSEVYQDRRIEVRKKGDRSELRIDNVPMKFHRDNKGQYRLEKYAYDPAPSLLDAIKRYIDYLERAAKKEKR